MSYAEDYKLEIKRLLELPHITELKLLKALQALSPNIATKLEYKSRERAIYDYNTLMYEAKQERKQDGEHNKA